MVEVTEGDREAAAHLAPSGFDPSRGVSGLSWLAGASDETYGTRVWYNRVENLRCHLGIIQLYLPDDKTWLYQQVQAAINEADRYLADFSPLCDSDGSPEGGDACGSVEDDSAGREASPHD